MEVSPSILIVTCEEHTTGPNPALTNVLEKAGYPVMMVNISAIESVIKRYTPALAIASLPGDPRFDLQLCHQLLHWIAAPVIVISTLDHVDLRVAALEVGVVDYLLSPVSPLIVAARVRNLLKRCSQARYRQERYH